MRLAVAEVLQIVPALLLGAHLQVVANLHTLALLIPALMIVAGNVVRDDPRTLRVVVDHVIELAVHAGRGDKLGLIEPGLAVNPVPGVEYPADAAALEVIVGGLENVQARMLIAEVVIRD